MELSSNTRLPERCLRQAALRVVADAFARHGEEIYLVGGAVRDCLLARPVRELDFATSARPEKILAIANDEALGRPYRVGERFGTIGIRGDGWVAEITTYRVEERYHPGSRKPDVAFGTALTQDLARRDFTINAIAADPRSGSIVDPFGGTGDLARGVVRAVGRPDERFREDPLRILRAVRFAGRLNFAIDAGTERAMREEAATLESISRERIRDELGAILTSGSAPNGLTMSRDCDLLAHTVPELLALTQMPDHGPRHPLSLWDHTMRVVAGVPARLALRWAALLHDIAKPLTRTHEPSGRPRFFHHEEVGAQIARTILSGLRYPNETVEHVVLLVETHMQLHGYSAEWSDGAIRRLCLRLGPAWDDALALARADAAGHSLSGTSRNSEQLDQLEARAGSLDRRRAEEIKSPLSGVDLMERYRRPPGPWIRAIKQALESEVIEGRLAPENREAAWEIADRMAANGA